MSHYCFILFISFLSDWLRQHVICYFNIKVHSLWQLTKRDWSFKWDFDSLGLEMEGFFLAFSILKTFSSLSALVLFFLHKTKRFGFLLAQCSLTPAQTLTHTCTQYSQITFHCIYFCTTTIKLLLLLLNSSKSLPLAPRHQKELHMVGLRW